MKHKLHWIVAILTFGVGDLGTTALFLWLNMNHEGAPLAVAALDVGGVASLAVLKTIVLGGFVIAYKISPRDYRVGIPLGLALLGSVITVWNTYSSVTGARIYI